MGKATSGLRFSRDQSRICFSAISATSSKSMGRSGSETDKISLYGELGLRNRPHQENHARYCQEIQELRIICCEETDRARQARVHELPMQQQRNPTTVSQLLTQIQEFLSKVNSLSDAGEFYDPESGSSAGATHVPSQPSTFPSPRTLPRCDSGLPRNTKNCRGTSGNVSERPPVQEGLSSTVFHNSKNLASSSQDLRPDSSETARREMKRESLNTSTQSPHLQSRSGMLNHTGGTYSHSGMMDYLRILTTEWNLGQFPDSMEFHAGKSTSELRFIYEQQILKITMLWIKEVETAKSIDELVTSRSIVGRTDFPDVDMLDAMIPSAKKKLLNTQIHFRKRVSVEEQRAQKSDRSLRGRQIAYMVHEYFHATRDL